MVNVIWVLENIRKSTNFYNPFDTKLILTSVSQCKKHNPNTRTVLYCDKLTYDVFNKIYPEYTYKLEEPLDTTFCIHKINQNFLRFLLHHFCGLF